MSEGNNSVTDLSAIAEDMKYFKSLVDIEKDEIRNNIEARIQASKDPYSHLSIVTDVLTDTFAQLSTRLKILESVLAGKETISLAELKIDKSVRSDNNLSLVEEISVGAEQFAHEENMYGLETTDDGTHYTWTGPSAKLSISLPVKRDQNKNFSLLLLSVIDESVLDNIKVLVDGVEVESTFSMKDNLRSLDAVLINNNINSHTSIEILIDRTFSPMELGKGDDMRSLGLAIAGYSVLKDN